MTLQMPRIRAAVNPQTARELELRAPSVSAQELSTSFLRTGRGPHAAREDPNQHTRALMCDPKREGVSQDRKLPWHYCLRHQDVRRRGIQPRS